MHTDDTGVTDLLRRASVDLSPDVDHLVSGAMARGRSRQRRARIGTTVAALAVIGIVGGLAAVLPQVGPDRTAGGVATDVASLTPGPTPAPVAFSVPATEFPATVREILGLTDVSPALQDPRYPDMVEDTEDIKSARFRVNGMLVHVMVFGGEVGEETRAGDGSSAMTWAPSEGVVARAASFRRNDYVIAVVAYNAAEDSNSPELAPEPVLSESQILQVVTSDAWFEGPQ